MYKSEARILEVKATISEPKNETKVLGSVSYSTEQCRGGLYICTGSLLGSGGPLDYKRTRKDT